MTVLYELGLPGFNCCLTSTACCLQAEQHRWAEEGAELRGRLTAHEAQLDLMQVNMRETDQARTNLAHDLARLRLELEKVSTLVR